MCIRDRAYIKDITAGTYRQLVEAAESCQVAIIHPGQPRNPCLLYTSDAADDLPCVDFGGRRIIKKKK